MTAYSFVSPKNGKKYYLHSKEIQLKNGREQRIYYFCQDIREEALLEVPKGYEVVLNGKTGLPFLRRTK